MLSIPPLRLNLGVYAPVTVRNTLPGVCSEAGLSRRVEHAPAAPGTSSQKGRKKKMNRRTGMRIRVDGPGGPARWRHFCGILICSAVLASGQSPQFEWGRQTGSATGAVADTATAADADGNFYVAGSTDGALPGQTHAGAKDVFLRKYDVNGNALWTRQFGSSSYDEAFGVAVDANGNAFIVGVACGLLPGGAYAGGCDAFVRKYDPNGNALWTRQFGSPAGEVAYAAAVDTSGNVAVAGYTGGAFPGFTSAGDTDVFVRVYNASGAELWTRQFGTNGGDEARAASFDGSGNLIVGGRVRGALPGKTHYGFDDVFLAKFSAGGTEAWTVQSGSSGFDQITGADTDSAGNIYVAAAHPVGTLRKYDAAGALQWTVSVGQPVNAVAVDASSIFVAGSSSSALPGQTFAGVRDAYVRRYDLNGVEQWTRQFGTLQSDEALGVAVGSTAVLVAGATSGLLAGEESSGNRDAFVRKYDSAGTEGWTEQFGAVSVGFTYAWSVHARGAVYLAGSTTGTLPGQATASSEDAFVAKYEAAGSLAWLRQFGSDGNDYARGVATDSSGNVYVGGETTGALPGQTRTSAFGDAFLRKYDSAGGEVWTRQFGANSGSVLRINAVAVDAADFVYVTGWTTHGLSGQAAVGQYDVFVRKYDPNGNELWTRQFGTAANDYGLALTASQGGGVIVAGYTQGTLPGQAKSGSDDAFLARIDSSGAILWVTQFGTLAGTYTRAYALAEGPDGSVFAGGHLNGTFPGQATSGSQDAFVRKLSGSGVEQWTRQFGSAGLDEARGLAVDASGTVSVIGYTTSALPGQMSAGSQDAFARRYDADGNEAGTLQFGTAGPENVLAGAGDSTGALYAAGYGFGPLPGQTQTGYFDAILIKFRTNATPVLTMSQGALNVAEGSVAANSGTFTDSDAGDVILLSASVGTVTKTGRNQGAWNWTMPAADGPAAMTVIISASDGRGGVSSVSFPVAVSNVPPSVAFSAPPEVNEAQTITVSGLIADPGALDPHIVLIAWGDGATSTIPLAAGVMSFQATQEYADDSPTGTPSDTYPVSVTVTDKDGASGLATGSVQVNNVVPMVSSFSGPAEPMAAGSVASLSAQVSDVSSADTLTCTFHWDDGSSDPVVSPALGTCPATHAYGAAGVYTVQLSVQDDDGGVKKERFEYVVVYDPNEGFVTGGGWIQSPRGAYVADPELTGKAAFGFVSKYQKGADTPSGQTEFQFHAAGFRFTSTKYQWLVVSGSRAQYKGEGSLNGESGYGFLLTAVDGQQPGDGGTDKFRVKIWRLTEDDSPGTIVYDNVSGASDDLDSANPQVISGGAITIHRR